MDEVIPDISVQEYRMDNNDMNGSSEVASNCKDDEMVQECDDKMTTVTQKCDDNMVEVKGYNLYGKYIAAIIKQSVGSGVNEE